MSSIPRNLSSWSLSSWIGFHTQRTVPGKSRVNLNGSSKGNTWDDLTAATRRNLTTISGYVPIGLGQYQGYKKLRIVIEVLVEGSKREDYIEKAERSLTCLQKIYLCVRGLFEMLGLGLLFLPLDLGASAIRLGDYLVHPEDYRSATSEDGYNCYIPDAIQP